MMKVTVIKEFKDKYTQKIYAVGDEITVTKKRFEEIKKAGDYVSETTKQSNEQ